MDGMNGNITAAGRKGAANECKRHEWFSNILEIITDGERLLIRNFNNAMRVWGPHTVVYYLQFNPTHIYVYISIWAQFAQLMYFLA